MGQLYCPCYCPFLCWRAYLIARQGAGGEERGRGDRLGSGHPQKIIQSPRKTIIIRVWTSEKIIELPIIIRVFLVKSYWLLPVADRLLCQRARRRPQLHRRRPGGGRGGERLGSGHPQKIMQSPNRLYKAPTVYTRPPKDYTQSPKDYKRPDRQY